MIRAVGLAVSAILLSGTLALAQAPVDTAEHSQIEQIMRDRVERDGQGVGLAGAVIVADQPVFANVGMQDVDGETPIDEHTIFEIGSITKIFTNLLLAQLVVEGKMDLDKPVADYLPEGTKLPEFEGQAITVFDLATHSSGLPSIPPELAAADLSNPYADYDATKFYAFLASYTLTRAPGAEFEYSNIGTSLLGEAISHVAGKPYAELVSERILTPLGMSETSIAVEDFFAFAGGHNAERQPVSHWDLDVFAPAGAYRSTATDMAKFAAAASGQVSTPLDAAFAKMVERTRPAGGPGMTIGLGWMLLDGPDGQIIWHNGGTGGFNSFMGFDRTSKKAALVLSNARTLTGIEDIGFHLIDAKAPLTPQPKPRAAVEIDLETLPNYVGRYQLGPEMELSVTTEGGRLFVEAAGQGKLEVFPESATTFFAKIVDAQISFEIGADGKASGLVLHQNGQDITGKRL